MIMMHVTPYGQKLLQYPANTVCSILFIAFIEYMICLPLFASRIHAKFPCLYNIE